MVMIRMKNIKKNYKKNKIEVRKRKKIIRKKR